MNKKLLFAVALTLVITSCSKGGESSSLPSSSESRVESQSEIISSDVSSKEESSIEPIKKSCGYDGTVSGVHFILPDLGENVEIHTEMQKAYLESKYYGTVNRYADGLSEASYQELVKLTWSAEGNTSTNYKVNLSIDEDFSSSLTYECNKCEVNIDNLMIGTTYYWSVTIDDSITSGTAKFVTTDVAPRNLRIPGVKNVRDMGGIVTSSGKKIKQNRIIRCGALTQNETGKRLIEPEGIDIFNNQFHMKTELDLRGETTSESGNLTQSILGKQVNYKLVGLKYSGADCLLENKSKLNDIFSIFAKEDN